MPKIRKKIDSILNDMSKLEKVSVTIDTTDKYYTTDF